MSHHNKFIAMSPRLCRVNQTFNDLSDLIVTLVQYEVSMAKQKFNNTLRQRSYLTEWFDESAITAWTVITAPWPSLPGTSLHGYVHHDRPDD